MALIANTTRVTLDGLRVVECFDAAPFTASRAPTLAEQLTAIGGAVGAEMLRVAVASLPAGHTGTVGVAGNVFTITIT